MGMLTVAFTRRKWNPVSWLIRWAMPRTRFAWALSSHAILMDGDTCYEATMLHGVRKTDRATALAGQVIVREKLFWTPDHVHCLDWLESQVGKPYDWLGAFGLSLAPDRRWADDDAWFCYELAAGALRASGRPVFPELSHIGETALLAIGGMATDY